MDATMYDGGALQFVLVKPKGVEDVSGYPMLILLHGFGANMRDLANMSTPIDPHGYVYAYPNGPYRADFGMGQVGYSWFAGRPGVQEPPPGSPDLDELLSSFLAGVIELTGAEPGRIVLGGFSQGGNVTLRYGLPRPGMFAGLADLSGPFREALDESGLPESRDQRIFIAHGRFDNVVPIDNGGLAAKAYLEEHGYAPVYREYDMAHEINHGVIRDLRTWLHETLPPHTPEA